MAEDPVILPLDQIIQLLKKTWGRYPGPGEKNYFPRKYIDIRTEKEWGKKGEIPPVRLADTLLLLGPDTGRARGTRLVRRSSAPSGQGDWRE